MLALISRKDVESQLIALPGWSLAEGGRGIRKTYSLADFAEAVSVIDRILPLAEEADHHPDLHLTGYRRLEVVLSTHSAGGVTEKDFALAARIEALPKKPGKPVVRG